ncbi:MAG: SDR family NAD(P)-dependent oxidoreductase [Myxococcota bacterium]
MRRVLVTGANKGIGLAIVTAILEEHDDTFAFLGSRDPGRGQAACEGLVAAHPAWSDRLEVLELDVSSDASVGAAAERVRAAVGDEATPLYGIVNNAGIGLGAHDLRAMLEVNTLGVRRVCESFLPLLCPSGGRIVNITSASGPNFVHECSDERQRFFVDPAVTWPQIQALLDECLALEGAEAFAAKGLGRGNAYGLSKACANSYTMLLAREHPNLRINACTPGFIETDLTRPYAQSSGKTPQDMGMKSPAEGARAPLALLFGELEGNGRYYGSDAKRSPLDRYRAPGSEPYTGEP